MHKKNILFLYTELAGYTVACLDELNKCDVEVFLINWAVNKEAPFQFNINAIHQSFRDEYSNDEDLIRYCKSINPDILLEINLVMFGCQEFNKRDNFGYKLGYSDEKIMTGFYSKRIENYSILMTGYKNNKDLKSKNYPKVFLFVGRYVKAKGISNLWDAFIELDSEYENNWELWCVGTGEEFIIKGQSSKN